MVREFIQKLVSAKLHLEEQTRIRIEKERELILVKEQEDNSRDIFSQLRVEFSKLLQTNSFEAVEEFKKGRGKYPI